MFSRAGAEANLKKLNPDWTPDKVKTRSTCSTVIARNSSRNLLPREDGITIALHNNGPGYSVADEQPISDAASIREPDNLHAFFLCTDPGDFKILSTSPYNVVLQQKAPPTDDGSLSRLAAARGRRYVNLEVGLGHNGRQKEMLDWLEWNLDEDGET